MSDSDLERVARQRELRAARRRARGRAAPTVEPEPVEKSAVDVAVSAALGHAEANALSDAFWLALQRKRARKGR